MKCRFREENCQGGCPRFNNLFIQKAVLPPPYFSNLVTCLDEKVLWLGMIWKRKSQIANFDGISSEGISWMWVCSCFGNRNTSLQSLQRRENFVNFLGAERLAVLWYEQVWCEASYFFEMYLLRACKWSVFFIWKCYKRKYTKNLISIASIFET